MTRNIQFHYPYKDKDSLHVPKHVAECFKLTSHPPTPGPSKFKPDFTAEVR